MIDNINVLNKLAKQGGGLAEKVAECAAQPVPQYGSRIFGPE